MLTQSAPASVIVPHRCPCSLLAELLPGPAWCCWSPGPHWNRATCEYAGQAPREPQPASMRVATQGRTSSMTSDQFSSHHIQIPQTIFQVHPVYQVNGEIQTQSKVQSRRQDASHVMHPGCCGSAQQSDAVAALPSCCPGPAWRWRWRWE